MESSHQEIPCGSHPTIPTFRHHALPHPSYPSQPHPHVLKCAITSPKLSGVGDTCKIYLKTTSYITCLLVTAQGFTIAHICDPPHTHILCVRHLRIPTENTPPRPAPTRPPVTPPNPTLTCSNSPPHHPHYRVSTIHVKSTYEDIFPYLTPENYVM